jgi:lysophospholipase L1-like esterase
MGHGARPGLLPRITAIASVALMVVGGGHIAQAAIAGTCESPRWQTTWLTALQDDESSFEDQTIRVVVPSTIGGDAVRITLSNREGEAPVTFDDVHVALGDHGATVVASTVRPVTFDGDRSVTVAPGDEVTSDGVALAVEPGDDIATTFHVAGAARLPRHLYAQRPSYATPSGSGAFGDDVRGAPFTEVLRSWVGLAAVDVEVPRPVGSIAALGDSLTDGTGATFGTASTWPDVLADSLDGDAAVLNAGIASNLVAGKLLPPSDPIYDDLPDAMADRLATDVLARDGVTDLVVLAGLNDVIFAVDPQPVDAVIAAYGSILDEAHDHGLRVIGATLTPGAFDEEREARRQAINTWIRTSGAFDVVVDFDDVVADAAAPSQLLPVYDSGDGIHLSDAGYAALASTVRDEISPTNPCAA